MCLTFKTKKTKIKSMKKFKITATYKADVELVVSTGDDVTEEQALDPSTWVDILQEDQIDYRLYDTTESEEVEAE